MKKIIYIMLALCLVLPLINAATDTKIVDDSFQVNTIINYSKPCFYNNTYCSSNAICNFSIFRPNNLPLVNNINATNKNNYHTITFYVEDIGIHKADMICTDNGINGADTFYFEVTGSGYNNTTGLYLTLLIIGFALIGFAFWIKDVYMALFGSFVFYFIGIYSLRYGIDFIRNIWLTRSVSFIILGVAAYISINSAMELLDI